MRISEAMDMNCMYEHDSAEKVRTDKTTVSGTKSYSTISTLDAA